MGNKAKAAVRAAETQELRRQALELRKQGFTYAEIAAGLSCATSHAHRLVTEALADIPREVARDVRDLELARLDTLQNAAWERAKGGNEKAIAIVVRIMERRAAMLGLDAPKQEILWGTSEPFDVDKALG